MCSPLPQLCASDEEIWRFSGDNSTEGLIPTLGPCTVAMTTVNLASPNNSQTCHGLYYFCARVLLRACVPKSSPICILNLKHLALIGKYHTSVRMQLS